MSDFSQGVESVESSLSTFPIAAASSSGPATIDAPLREGLPATYRMRADAHYIDILDSTPVTPLQSIALHAIDAPDDLRGTPDISLVDSIKRHGLLEPLLVQKRDRRYRLITGKKRLAASKAAGLREVPCVVHCVSDEEAATLAAAAIRPAAAPVTPPRPVAEPMDAELSRSLAAVLSATDLLSDGLPALTRDVATDMIRAEVQRAACVIHATRVMQHGVGGEPQRVSARAIVERVARIVTPDARLRGLSVATVISVDDTTELDVDADLLAATLSHVVLTMSAALKRAAGARLKITATAEAGDRVTLSVVQDAVVLPQSWVTLPEHSELRNVADPRMPLLVLREVAESYGGRLTTGRLPHGSCVSVELPVQMG